MQMDVHLDIMFHHGGKFQKDEKGMTIYSPDKKACVGDIDVDTLDVFWVRNYYKELGYDRIGECWWHVPGRSLDIGLRALNCNDELREMCFMGKKNEGLVDVYFEHAVSTPEILEGNEIVEYVEGDHDELREVSDEADPEPLQDETPNQANKPTTPADETPFNKNTEPVHNTSPPKTTEPTDPGANNPTNQSTNPTTTPNSIPSQATTTTPVTTTPPVIPSGMPCVHACAALARVNKRPEDFCHKWLTMDAYRDTYAHYINPLPGQSLWEKSDQNRPQAPKKKKKPRPVTKKRRKDADEGSTCEAIQVVDKKEVLHTTIRIDYCGSTTRSKLSDIFKTGQIPEICPNTWLQATKEEEMKIFYLPNSPSQIHPNLVTIHSRHYPSSQVFFSNVSPDKQTTPPLTINIVVRAPKDGLLGLASVVDHRRTGRHPHPHHCGTTDALLRLELLLLDRMELWLPLAIMLVNSEGSRRRRTREKRVEEEDDGVR
ncbi:hypothetical protein Ahy_B10g105672 [Arachis hypogaea]|uniref:PB1-like domain-containing protein n=1 Tax=Arachis hypogaea TaxID=3818 RepID=A0A444X8I6_ARAHY|nr:hypothetical protein Ahy_B10g105672 [Arachis hypogaea]